MKTLTRLLTICFVMLGLSGCGDDDCPTCPEPPTEQQYHFLYSFGGDFNSSRVYTFSTKELELVDSAQHSGVPFSDARYSQNGDRLFCTSGVRGREATWIAEANSGDTISIVSGVWSHWLQLFHDEQHILLAGGGIRMYVLAVPTLEVVYEEIDSSGWGEGAVDPKGNRAWVPKPTEDSLIVLTIEMGMVGATKFPLKNLRGEPARAIAIEVTPDGKHLLLSVGDFPTGSAYIQVRNVDDLRLIAEINLSFPLSRAYPHPDSRRVLYREWTRYQENNPGALWKLDLKTMVLERILDGSNLIGGGSTSSVLDPIDLAFTPDGEFAIVANGSGLAGYGPILKVNLKDYTIADSAFPPLGVSQCVRMNPKVL